MAIQCLNVHRLIMIDLIDSKHYLFLSQKPCQQYYTPSPPLLNSLQVFTILARRGECTEMLCFHSQLDLNTEAKCSANVNTGALLSRDLVSSLPKLCT